MLPYGLSSTVWRKRPKGMATPLVTASGKWRRSSPSLAAFGPTIRPESEALRSSRGMKLRTGRSSFCRSGRMSSSSARVRPSPRRASQDGPSSASSTTPPELTASTTRWLSRDRTSSRSASSTATLGMPRLRARSWTWERGLPEPAVRIPGEGRQIRDGLGQDVDPVGADLLEPLHVRPGVEDPAGEAGVEGVQPDPHVLAVELVVDARQPVGVAQEPVEDVRRRRAEDCRGAGPG